MTIASSPLAVDLARPGIDIARAEASACRLAAHVMHQRAAAAFALRHHDLDAEAASAAGSSPSLMPGSSTDCAQPVRSATRLCRFALRREADPGPHRRSSPAACPARALSIAPSRAPAVPNVFSSGANGRPSFASLSASAEAAADRAARARAASRISRSRERPPVGLLDMDAGLVDQMHVVDARGAGGHAGEAGQAAVDVGDDLRRSPAGRSPACP